MAMKNIIVIKKPGVLIAEAYLQRVVKDSTFLGTALVHEGKLVIDHQSGKPTVEGLNSIQDGILTDRTIVFNFGENKTILDEDRQPFRAVLDKDKGHEVAVFLTGNFNGYEVKGSSHTHEYHCFEDFLSKKLPKIYRSAGGGLAEFLAELNDPITQQDLSNSWTDRGFITLLTTEGEAISIANKGNVFKRDYSWGTTSDGLAYEEKAVEPAKVEAPKKLSLLDKIMAKKADAAAPEGVKETPTATAIVDKALDTYEDVGPAPKELKNAEKIVWWINEIGYKPEKYKDLATRVKRLKGTKVGILAPLAATNVKDAATPLTNEEVKALPEKVVAEAPEGAKDISPKHVSMDNLPLLSPKQKLKLHADWMKDSEVVKLLGDDFKALAFDPKRLKEFEDNYQTFYDGMGLEGDKTWLSFEALMKLGATDMKALAIYAFNRQNDNVQTSAALTGILTNPNNKIATKVAM